MLLPSSGSLSVVLGNGRSHRCVPPMGLEAMERAMKLAIFAATGGIGRQLVEQAVAAGHDVTAVVRNPKKVSEAVRTVTVDLAAADPAALEAAGAGADAVISGLGPRSSA